MRFLACVLAVGAGLAVSVAELAGAGDATARVLAPVGTVFVTQTTSAVRAQDGMALHAGDRLSLLRGATVKIVYANGCTVTLSGSTALTIGAMPSCGTPAASGETGGTAPGSVAPTAIPLPARRASR